MTAISSVMPKVMKIFLTMLSLLFLTSVNSEGRAQELIATCGPSSGKAYTMDNNKWSDDEGHEASNKATTFLLYPNGQYDIIYKGQIGGGSEREQGAKIYKVQGEDKNLLTLLSVWPRRTTELFKLTFSPSGEGTLIWSIFKNKDGPFGLTCGEVSV
jgi:hypothetical protein